MCVCVCVREREREKERERDKRQEEGALMLRFVANEECQFLFCQDLLLKLKF